MLVGMAVQTCINNRVRISVETILPYKISRFSFAVVEFVLVKYLCWKCKDLCLVLKKLNTDFFNNGQFKLFCTTEVKE